MTKINLCQNLFVSDFAVEFIQSMDVDDENEVTTQSTIVEGSVTGDNGSRRLVVEELLSVHMISFFENLVLIIFKCFYKPIFFSDLSRRL